MLWIQGEEHSGRGEPLRSVSPADGSLVLETAAADPAQVSLAVAAADAAAANWAESKLEEREAILRRFADAVSARKDEFAELISREIGKLPADAAGEVAAVVAKVEVTIRAHRERRGEIERPLQAKSSIAQVRYRPLGPVIVLGPYNFPAHLPGGQIIPALLAGNCVVFKPSEQAPAVGRWIVDRFTEAGLPPGVIGLVQGGREVARALVDDPRIGGVFFTGGYAAGRSIHQQLAGRPEVLLALEMGGNNPLVVAPPPQQTSADTAGGTSAPRIDVAETVELIFESAFASSGQRCTCARRLIVIDDDYGQAVIDALVQKIESTRYGVAGDDPPPQIGPLISPQAAAAIVEAADAWIHAGAQPLCRPELIPFPTGSFGPTIVRCGLIDVSKGGMPEDEEWFGPLLQLHRVDDFDQAIALAGATRFGLAAGLIGGDAAMFDRFRREVPAGVINWNRPLTGASGELPFGGVKHSGNHRPAGAFAVDFCSDPVAGLIRA